VREGAGAVLNTNNYAKIGADRVEFNHGFISRSLLRFSLHRRERATVFLLSCRGTVQVNVNWLFSGPK